MEKRRRFIPDRRMRTARRKIQDAGAPVFKRRRNASGHEKGVLPANQRRQTPALRSGWLSVLFCHPGSLVIKGDQPLFVECSNGLLVGLFTDAEQTIDIFRRTLVGNGHEPALRFDVI